MDDRAEALLYAADRAQHVSEVIKPALDAGKVVVSDRFVDSSLAYQGLGRGLGLNDIYNISAWATGGLIPNLVFFLDIDPEAGLRRRGGEPDRIEGAGGDFHSKVNEAYLELAKKWPNRFVVIDAGRPTEEVLADVIAAFDERARRDAPMWPAAAMDFGAPGPPVPR
jgi:dTMP kinase